MNRLKTTFTATIILAAVLLSAACGTKRQLPALAADATILAFGDSLTFGTGAGESESYPAVLSRLTGRKVVNAGVPGEVSALGVQRLPDLLDRERPALLILCHGANDLLRRQDQQQMADNLRTMIRTARERGVSVMLVAVPFPDFSLKPPRLYDSIGGEFGIPVERKVLRQILKKSSLKSDYIHPNAAGYRLMAEALEKQLKTSGALP
jgi:acyl-CoA thioesterase-1